MGNRIAEILAECLERIEAGANVESCLADFPYEAAELEPLLRVTQQMSPLSNVRPRPFFAQNARANLEQQLVMPHGPAMFNRRSPQTRQRPRPVVQGMNWFKFAVATVLALTATTGGVAFAANSSNPGDLLHGLDLAMENVQMNLAPDVASKVELRLAFASERLTEAQETFAENDVADGLEAVNEYGSEISAASQLIGSAGGADEEALQALLEAAQGAHQEVLTQLLDKAPDPAKDGIQKALDASKNNGKPEEVGNPNGSGNPTNDPMGAENPNGSDHPENPGNPHDGSTDGPSGRPSDPGGSPDNVPGGRPDKGPDKP